MAFELAAATRGGGGGGGEKALLDTSVETSAPFAALVRGSLKDLLILLGTRGGKDFKHLTFSG